MDIGYFVHVPALLFRSPFFGAFVACFDVLSERCRKNVLCEFFCRLGVSRGACVRCLYEIYSIVEPVGTMYSYNTAAEVFFFFHD